MTNTHGTNSELVRPEFNVHLAMLVGNLDGLIPLRLKRPVNLVHAGCRAVVRCFTDTLIVVGRHKPPSATRKNRQSPHPQWGCRTKKNLEHEPQEEAQGNANFQRSFEDFPIHEIAIILSKSLLAKRPLHPAS